MSPLKIRGGGSAEGRRGRYDKLHSLVTTPPNLLLILRGGVKNMSLLEIKNCSVSFGGIKALTSFNTQLGEAELLGIIGPNGAGKTTLFNLLTGVYSPTEGEIKFKNESIQGKKLYEINQRGIARTFQNIRLFQNLKVEDNVILAYHNQIKASFLSSSLHFPSMHQEEKELSKKAFDLLEMLGLLDHRLELAKNLPYGDQRRLEIVRALATSPKLLLLDEPAAGMNPTEKNELIKLIRDIQKEFNLAIILIEHDMHVVMNLCPRLIVLNYGVMLAEGTPDQIRNNPKVIEAYLGEKKAAPQAR